SCSSLEIPVTEDFDLRRPDPAEALILGECFPDSGPPKRRTWCLVGVCGQLGSNLHLKKAASRQQLSERGERFEERGAYTEVTGPVTRWQCNLALPAKDGSALETGEQGAFISKHDVADSADPACVLVVQKAEGKGELDLISRAEPFF